MFDHDEIAADLPAPRDDEPPGLRRAIVEELVDHLNCALQRELHRTGDERLAKQNVLSRFGDPAAVAYRLWWDAMKERIMSQRLMLAASIVMALACVGLFGLMWRSQAANQAALQHQQAQVTELMQQMQLLMQQLADRPEPAAAPSEWNPVELRFVRGSEDGPPAEGVKVDLELSHETNPLGIPPLSGTSDERGIVRFANVRFGKYSGNVIMADGIERGRVSLTVPFGEAVTQNIVCPPVPLRTQEVRVKIAWPENLQGKPVWVSLTDQDLVRPLDGRGWSWRGRISEGPRADTWDRHLVSPDGTVFEARNRMRPHRGWGSDSAEFEFWWLRNEPVVLRWPDPDYRLQYVELLVPDGSQLAEAIAADRSGRLAAALTTGATVEARGFSRLRRPASLGSPAELRTAPDALANFIDLVESPETRIAGEQVPGDWRMFAVSPVWESVWLETRIEPGDPATLWITPSPEMVRIASELLTMTQEGIQPEDER